MKKAETGKVNVVRDDASIVAIDIGMEMNRGYSTVVSTLRFTLRGDRSSTMAGCEPQQILIVDPGCERRITNSLVE